MRVGCPRSPERLGSETAVAVQYRRPDGVVSRKLRPLGLVLKGGILYFVALSDEQTLDTIVCLTWSRSPPRKSALRVRWVSTWLNSGPSRRRLSRPAFTERQRRCGASPRGVEKLTLFGAAVAQAVVESAGAPDADGWVTVTIPIELIDQAATDLLRLGLDAEALEPVDLRRRIQSLVEDVRSLYACSAAPDTERVFGR